MKRLRIGIIGTGMRTVFLMQEILKMEELEIVAVADVSTESLDMVTDCYDGEWEQYLDYEEMLRRPDLDGVIIASPDYAHEEQAIASLRAGKHVFLEKPIAITAEGAQRILEERDKSGKTLLVGFVLRYCRLYQKLKEIVGSGMIGEVKTGWVLHSVGASSNWYFHDWHGTMKNTAGLLLQKGSHDLDMISWIVDSSVKHVTGFGSLDYFGGDKPDDATCQTCKERKTCSEATTETIHTLTAPNGKRTKILYNRWRNQCAFRQEIDVPDNHQLLLEYGNGVRIAYLECHYAPDDNREYTFVGTKGKVTLDDAGDRITVLLRKGMHDRAEKIVYSGLKTDEGHDGGDYHIIEDFVEAMKTGNQPLASCEAGLAAVKTACLAHEAIRLGTIEHLF